MSSLLVAAMMARHVFFIHEQLGQLGDGLTWELLSLAARVTNSRTGSLPRSEADPLASARSAPVPTG